MPHSIFTQPLAARFLFNRRAWSWLFGLTLLVSSNITHAAEPAADESRMQSDALVFQVLEQNPGIAALSSAVIAANAAIEQAGALPDPMLTAAVAPQTIGGYDSPTDRGANVRIEFSQALPWPGKLDLKSDVARFEALAANEDVASLRLQLAALTRSAYAEWQYVHRALEINESNEALIDQLRSVAESRYAAGLSRQQDVLQAEVEQQHVRHRTLQLQRQRKTIQARINALLNQSPDTALPAPEDTASSPKAIADFSELQEIAASHHPELNRLKVRASANQSRASLAQKQFYPDFNVFTGYNGLWDADEKRWVVGASINLPLNQSKRRAAVDEALANTVRIEAELDDRRAQILSALQQAVASEEEFRHTVHLYQQQLVPRTEENLSAARSEYGSGAGSFLDVITAEKLLLNAQLGLERARADHLIALAEVQRWVGNDPVHHNAKSNTAKVQP